MQLNPKISVIVATYNAEEYIERCLNSINKESIELVEIIVVDGKSKDKTVDVLGSLDFIDFWISEPDKGIYDAWNKGLKIARGEWIMFLGADDILMEGAIEKYLVFIEKLKEPVEYISSKMNIVDIHGGFIQRRGKPWQWPLFLKETMTAHPGSLHSRRLFEKYGDFNIDYKIVGDTELLLRAKGDLKYAFMDEVTVAMQAGGASDSLRAIRERYKATVKTGGAKPVNAFIYGLIISMKFLTKKALQKIGVYKTLKGGLAS
jgi:glycosyltransferase involved in cell wall biosynthesis